MGRSPCCDDVGGLKKGPWTPEEDKKLVDYIQKNGHGSWRNLPKNAGLNRCGKSCRLRWTNYLRPDIKRGKFAEDEERLIIHLHSVLGNKWSAIAGRLPGRTDNEIKNYWNTHLRKKLLLMGIDPVTHQRRTNLDILTAGIPNLMIDPANLSSLNALRLQADAAQLAKLQLLQNLVQVVSSSSTPANMDAMNLLGGSASLRNHQFSELLQFNRQLEGLVNACSLGLVQDPISTSLGYPNFPHTSDINQAGVDPSLPLQRNEMVAEMNNSCFNEVANNRMLSSVDAPTANSTPSLISTSSEMTPIDHVQEPINSNDASVISSASTSTTPLDGHDSFNLDDLDTDFSWKDILDQISWSDEL